ncbi:MAG: ParB/RepB/Spo0J family partition protein [Plesiomonas shigelloides]
MNNLIAMNQEMTCGEKTVEIKATSIGQAYKNHGADLDIKVNKTFMVPVNHLVVEDGFNVRELDQNHIDQMAQAYSDGCMMPALVVRTTKDGFKVVDGHHRLSAAKIAGVHRLECKEFTGAEAEQIAFMVSSSQGRNLKPIERAHAYRRLMNIGLTKDEIAKAVRRSRGDVDNHLLMLEAGDEVLQAIKNGEVAATEVQKEIRKSGADATNNIMQAVKKARESGGKAKLKSFTKKHQDKVMEILSGMDGLQPELKELVDLWLSDSVTK